MKFNLKNKKLYVIASVLGALSVGGYMVINNQNNELSAEDMQMDNEIETYTIQNSDSIYINGKVTPKKLKSFTPDPSLGAINSIKVTTGEVVDKGDILFVYKNADKETELKGFEEELKNAKSDLAYLKKNPDENVLEIKSMERQIKSIESNISKVKSEITTSVKAPFDGVVYLNKNYDESTGMDTILTLQSRDYCVEGTVTERDLLKLKVGMSTNIHIFSTGENRVGSIREISEMPIDNMNQGDGMNGSTNLSSYPVVIDFESNEKLVSGFNAQVRINISEKDITIPSTAIFTEENKQYVLLDKDGIAKKQLIETETLSNQEMIKVISGLDSGDIIIRDVEASKLQSGDSIYGFDGGVMGE